MCQDPERNTTPPCPPLVLLGGEAAESAVPRFWGSTAGLILFPVNMSFLLKEQELRLTRFFKGQTHF